MLVGGLFALIGIILSFKFGPHMVEKWKMDDAECRENGEALNEFVDQLPWGIGEKLAETGPGARAITTVGGSFLKRMELNPTDLVREHHAKNELAQRRAARAAEAAHPVLQVEAPDPGAVPSVRPGAGDIFIPPPPNGSSIEPHLAGPGAPMIRPEDITGVPHS